MDAQYLKKQLRLKMKAVREKVHAIRQKQAALIAYDQLFSLIPKEGLILSYMPFNSELDVSLINRRLLDEKRLALPSVENDFLKLHLVSSFDDLQLSSFGILEPKLQSQKVSVDSIAAVLVPGLAFDQKNQRLGYGKGHYDRLLAHQKFTTIGMGFKEQLQEEELPSCEQDVALHRLLLC